LLQRQISSNASVPIYEVRSQHKTFSLQENRTLDRRRPLFATRSGNKMERSPWRLPWHAGAIRGRLNALVPQLRDGLSLNAFMLSAIPLALVRALHVESASGLAFFGETTRLTAAEWCAAGQLKTGWLLAQALRSQSNSVWQLVRARQRKRPPNQPERTR